MSVVVISNKLDFAEALVHLLISDGIEVPLLVLQTTVDSEEMGSDRNELATRSTFTRFKDIFYGAERRKALNFEQEAKAKARGRIQHFLDSIKRKQGPLKVEVLETPSLHEATVVTAIKKAGPKVCAVIGSPVISPRLVSIPELGTINVHFSILPEYRGAKSEFWQCYNQSYDNVGITFYTYDTEAHFGNLLLQVNQRVGRFPEPHDLRATNVISMFENYGKVIKLFLDGRTSSKPMTRSITPNYRKRDITEEKLVKLYGRLAADSAKPLQ